jgi:predicted O-methyltransferase YrrM
LIVDIGAAEGYYAVGLSRRLPRARVVAFEMEQRGQMLLGKMIELNGLQDRIEIRGKCELDNLKAVLATEPGSALVVCDCEGHENILLDPAAIPDLRRAMILMESHDIFEPGTADRITERFSATHEVARTWSVDRTPADYPYPSLVTRLLPEKYMKWAVSEWRPVPMSWLWMRPRGK